MAKGKASSKKSPSADLSLLFKSIAFKAMALLLGFALALQLSAHFLLSSNGDGIALDAQMGLDASPNVRRDADVAGDALEKVVDKNVGNIRHLDTSGRPPHLYPRLPILPAQRVIPNADELEQQTMNGSPTISGIAVILSKFVAELHKAFKEFKLKGTQVVSIRDEVVEFYIELTKKIIFPFEAVYRGSPIFPIRDDDSIYLSLASFRDHMLSETLRIAFRKAANPDKLFVGAIIQNCFGLEETCKTGFEVIGKDEHGRDMTKVSDAPPDRNGVAEFCAEEEFAKYCNSGQIRTLYVNETEALGPAVARYFASRFWGGETYYVQVDAHLQFADHWDEKYIAELQAAKSYPKAILSSYPPGFTEGKGGMKESNGARLCSCEFSHNDVEEKIIRINTGARYQNSPPRPTQIAFMAAGFFFTRAEWLVDVPFDPMLPWCFMGEEIALSIRSWTAGWDMYAPRKNLIAHQYRPGRMGLPKFWESVGRAFGKNGAGFNKRLQTKFVQRIKHMVGYPEQSRENMEIAGDIGVLAEYEHYSLGTVRSREDYLKLTNIDPVKKTCTRMSWCTDSTLE